jgi:hypothetical protein
MSSEVQGHSPGFRWNEIENRQAPRSLFRNAPSRDMTVAEAKMALRFPCPTCKRELVGPESVAGLEVQCPSCNAVFLAAKQADLEPIPFRPSRPLTPFPQETTEWAAPEPPFTSASELFLDGQAGDVGLPINQPMQQPASRRNRWLWTLLLLGELLVGRAFFLWRKEKADFHDEKDRTTRGLIVAILVSLLIVGGGFAFVVLFTK